MKRHFVFVANLKTASTSIETALKPFSDIALTKSEDGKHMPFSVIEERFSRMLDEVGREKFLIFGVMRNPVDFVLSLYNSHTDDRFKNDSSLYTGNLSFDEFLEHWTENNFDQVRPQFTRFLDKQGKIAANYIISYERLPDGLRYVASVTGVLSLKNLCNENVSLQRVRRSDLSDKQLAYISRHFEEDEQFAAQFCDRRLCGSLTQSERARRLAAAERLTWRTPQSRSIAIVPTANPKPEPQPEAYGRTGDVRRREAPDVRFVQTSDQVNYRALFDLTSRTVAEYCGRHGYEYESFLGICRGYYPWQATYNRISLLKRTAASGFRGWVCYMDADAFVADFEFELAGYLKDKREIAFIATTDRPCEPDRPFWLINAGVFLINLAHPIGQEIIDEWVKRFDAITDQQLMDAVEWTQLPNDQDLLQGLLHDLPEVEKNIMTLRGEAALLNYIDGLFIRQFLRRGDNVQTRIDLIRAETDRVLGRRTHQSDREHLLVPQLIRTLYRLLLLREPDANGLKDHVEWMRTGTPVEKIVRGFLESDEFISNGSRFIKTYLSDTRNVSGSDVTLKSNLTSLANKYRSDKGTILGDASHKYTYLYDLILDHYRNTEVNILELGLAAGGPEVGGPIERTTDSPSVRMWLDYFPRARVYGFDISDFSHIKHARFTFVRGDGGSPEDVRRLAHVASDFGIIVDDGSHASYHQQLAFKNLFPRLRSGGTYIIEDLHWQSPSFEAKGPLLPKTRDFMIKYFEQNRYIWNHLLTEDFMRFVQENLTSFAWFPAFEGKASPAKLLVFRKT
jgi:hypothetical protein